MEVPRNARANLEPCEDRDRWRLRGGQEGPRWMTVWVRRALGLPTSVLAWEPHGEEVAGKVPSPARAPPQRSQPPSEAPASLTAFPGPGGTRKLLGTPMSSSCGEPRAERRELRNHSQDSESWGVLGRPALGRERAETPFPPSPPPTRVDGGWGRYETGSWPQGRI